MTEGMKRRPLIYFNCLAGVKDKHAVIAVFGKSGYSALSWQQRAEKLNLNTEDLCERFRTNPDELRVLWEALPKKAAKAASGN